MEQNRDFYTSRGTHVYFKDNLINDEIDVEKVVADVESKLPEHLLTELEIIVIGWFDEFEDRGINAFYKDGILHISNVQDDEADLFDDIIHEVSHSLESVYGYEIYGDQKVKDEFLEKRHHLHKLLTQNGHSAPLSAFLDVEYNKEFDEYLFQTIGIDKLRAICMGIFINAYAAVSLREYFATGFTDFYVNSDHKYLKNLSPQLYRKLVTLHDINKLDK
jgi:Mlc titration factor MtfA (ptsG expression regulator)